MKQQRGFTLIELVMVIVVLGILAAVAIPKYVDLKSNAGTAAAQGVAAALASASAIKYAQAQLNGTAVPVNCEDINALLSGGALPTGFTNTVGAGPNCTVTHTASTATAAWTMSQ